MVVLVSAKNDGDSNQKTRRYSVNSTKYQFFKHSKAVPPQSENGMKFDLIRGDVVAPVTAKKDDDLIKTEGMRVLTTVIFQTLKGSYLRNP